jgi:predicted ATPase
MAHPQEQSNRHAHHDQRTKTQDDEPPGHPHDKLGYQITAVNRPRRPVFGKLLSRHGTLYFVGRVGQGRTQIDQFSVCIHVKRVFNSRTELFFRNVDTGLDCEHCTGTERKRVIPGIMDCEADVVTQSMNEVFPERFAVQVFAVLM